MNVMQTSKLHNGIGAKFYATIFPYFLTVASQLSFCGGFQHVPAAGDQHFYNSTPNSVLLSALGYPIAVWCCVCVPIAMLCYAANSQCMD